MLFLVLPSLLAGLRDKCVTLVCELVCPLCFFFICLSSCTICDCWSSRAELGQWGEGGRGGLSAPLFSPLSNSPPFLFVTISLSLSVSLSPSLSLSPLV